MTYEEKIQNLQHSILYLQEKQASTLNGLHKEIEKLQQKCSGKFLFPFYKLAYYYN